MNTAETACGTSKFHIICCTKHSPGASMLVVPGSQKTSLSILRAPRREASVSEQLFRPHHILMLVYLKYNSCCSVALSSHAKRLHIHHKFFQLYHESCTMVCCSSRSCCSIIRRGCLACTGSDSVKTYQCPTFFPMCNAHCWVLIAPFLVATGQPNPQARSLHT